MSVVIMLLLPWQMSLVNKDLVVGWNIEGGRERKISER